MATFITGDVIALSTITPDRFVSGFNWDSAGNVTAPRFVGDGLQMTGLAPGLSSLTVNDATFEITPAHNNAVIYFDNSGGTSVNIPFNPEFKDGHKTTIVQQGAGQVLITPANVYSQSGLNRTRTQYSVAELEYLANLNEWNLFGDLGVGSTYALNASTATVNEGASVTITLNTTLVSNGTLVPYTVNGGGSITTQDLSGASAGLTGNFTINNNSATRTFFLSSDNITEGTEYINLQLNNSQASISVPVIDTSNNSTYSLTRSVSSANEGASVIITLTAPAVPNGTNVPYTVTGINGADLSSGSLTGNFTINSGTATQTFTFSNDEITEGNETIVLALNNGLASISVLVLDTSKNPTPSFDQITVGSASSYALSGTDLYVCGDNSRGQLGLGTSGNNTGPTTYTKMAGSWTAIKAGDECFFALSGTNLYAVGSNQNNQMGIGNGVVGKSTFTQISGAWTAVFPSNNNGNVTFALSGTDLYAVGFNNAGNLGLNHDDYTVALFTKIAIPTNAKWTSASAGVSHSLALSGTDLYGTGVVSYVGLGGTTGLRSTFTKITTPSNAKWTAVSCGGSHSLALSGTDLYVTGSNVYGQLGLGDRTDENYFTKITTPSNAKWTAIFAGSICSFALSGTDLYATGLNTNGQLGLGDDADRSTFTKVPGKWSFVSAPGWNHTTLALSGNKLFSVGNNLYGQLGLGDTQNRSTFTQVTGVSA